MSSINDVLKEKFNVSGSNIAETLSKITPGGGSGGSGWLIANVIEETVNSRGTRDVTPIGKVTKLDKTAREILEASPFVLRCVHPGGDTDPAVMYDALTTLVPVEGRYIFAFGYYGEAGGYFLASTLDDYPIYTIDDEVNA